MSLSPPTRPCYARLVFESTTIHYANCWYSSRLWGICRKWWEIKICGSLEGSCCVQKAAFQARTHQMLCGLKDWVPVPWGPEQMGLPESNLKEEGLWQDAWFLPQLFSPCPPRLQCTEVNSLLSNILALSFMKSRQHIPMCFCAFLLVCLATQYREVYNLISSCKPWDEEGHVASRVGKSTTVVAHP